jgi:hypothetical protein
MSRCFVVARLIAVLCLTACLAKFASAQVDTNAGGNINIVLNEQSSISDDDITSLSGDLPGAGVVVDAKGVLSVKSSVDRTGGLDRQRRQQAQAGLNADVAKPSELRKVSLNRLEAALGKVAAARQAPPREMLYLAGLTKIQYVFYYPETKDIVIAGPAEGFALDEMRRPMGIHSGRSVLQLEDLVVALRAFGPDRRKVPSVGCSIDPTPEGLSRMQEFLSAFGTRATPRDTRRIVAGLKENLGLQVVTIKGISPNTHFANILVEADYRMKLIGIGLEEPPVRITSYVKRASAAAISRNAMQRWYFIPDYECVRVTDDGFAAELVGDGVKLVNADEVVRSDGTRMATGNSDRASVAFVESFTQRYGELARKVPVYAQLRNLIDMLIACAFIQDQDYYGQAGWNTPLFGNERVVSVEIHPAPRQVETAVNAIWKGNRLLTPVGGGVHIDARQAISAAQEAPEDGSLEKQREAIDLGGLAEGQWWWD